MSGKTYEADEHTDIEFSGGECREPTELKKAQKEIQYLRERAELTNIGVVEMRAELHGIKWTLETIFGRPDNV